MIDLKELAKLVSQVGVGATLHAEPGDTLLIVNNICIGVQKAPKLRALALKATNDRWGKRGGNPGSVNSQQAILDALKDGPLDTAHLVEKLGVDTKDPVRKRIYARIKRMKAHGMIKPVRGEKDKGRPRWEVS